MSFGHNPGFDTLRFRLPRPFPVVTTNFLLSLRFFVPRSRTSGNYPPDQPRTVKYSGDHLVKTPKAISSRPSPDPNSVSLRSFSPRQNSRPHSPGTPGATEHANSAQPSPQYTVVIRSSNFLRAFVRSGLPQSPWSGERSRRSRGEESNSASNLTKRWDQRENSFLARYMSAFIFSFKVRVTSFEMVVN